MSIYKIKNVATNKYLHVNIPNGTAVSSGESVVLCSESDTNEQWWDVSTLSNNAVIRFVINYRYSPNISCDCDCDCDCDCGNKCELQLISGNENNSFMNIIKTGSYYKIQHRSTSYYLTADGTYNGADTYWDTANGSNAQLWQFTEITPYEAISGEDYTYPNESRKIREEYSADHSGIDIVANEGDEVYAFANGVISYKQDVDNGDSKGICIAINHYNPDITIEAGLYATSIYMHLSSIRNLEIGTFVEKGQLIGYVGKTGDADVPHLHFALAVGSNNTMRPGVTGVSLASLNLIDPERYLTGYEIETTPTPRGPCRVFSCTHPAVCSDGTGNSYDDEHYCPHTAYMDGELNADIHRYIVIPINTSGYYDLLGCVGVVIRNDGRYQFGIVGDGGPAVVNESVSEFSVKMIRDLGFDTDGANYVEPEEPVTTYIFMNTRDDDLTSDTLNSAVEAIGQTLFY